jgi:hypothetical protein
MVAPASWKRIDPLAHDFHLRVGSDARRDLGRETIPVDGQSGPRRYPVLVRRRHDHGTEPPHLLVEQANRIVSASSDRKLLEQTSSARLSP